MWGFLAGCVEPPSQAYHLSGDSIRAREEVLHLLPQNQVRANHGWQVHNQAAKHKQERVRTTPGDCGEKQRFGGGESNSPSPFIDVGGQHINLGEQRGSLRLIPGPTAQNREAVSGSVVSRALLSGDWQVRHFHSIFLFVQVLAGEGEERTRDRRSRCVPTHLRSAQPAIRQRADIVPIPVPAFIGLVFHLICCFINLT